MKLLDRFKLGGLPYLCIESLMREGDREALAKALNALSPFELADLISKKDEEEQTIIFKALAPQLALHTFDYLPVQIQRRLLLEMPLEQTTEVLLNFSPDDRTSFLQDLPLDVIDRLVKLLPDEERRETLKLLGYPRGSVGRLMTPDYIAVELDWTIEKVLDHIQAYGHESETIADILVVDSYNHLLDVIRLKDFLFISRQSKVRDIATFQFVALSAYDSDEAAIPIFNKCNRFALPVIDDNGGLLGIVTVDDILKLAHEEATEDIQNIGAVAALDEPYMQAPFMELMRKRAGWLVVLFLGELLTATAMGYFENEIDKAVVLALFLPLIISSGGNAGSQASTLVVRAMALGEVALRDWWRITKREFLSGIFLGCILGGIGFLRVTLWSLFTSIYGPHWLLIACTIGISLIGVVLCGTLSGALLPVLLRRLNLDPAKASAPLVATIVDVSGIVIYFFFATHILKGTLL